MEYRRVSQDPVPLKYSSLVIGYNNLILVVTLLYAGALALQVRGVRRAFVVSPAE